jgi:hypothetical protein
MFDATFRTCLAPRIAPLLWLAAWLAPIAGLCWYLIGVRAIDWTDQGQVIGYTATPIVAGWIAGLLLLRIVLEGIVSAVKRQ